MPVYPWRPDDPRGLAREFSRIQRAADAARRLTHRTDVPDPTPPPVDVSPGSITAWLLAHVEREQT